ncbi:hypothetical protein IWZ00DRAFT_96827 [Phyllosticta capitalensis]
MGKRVLSHLFASERHFGKADDARACVFVVAVVWFGSRQLVACANVGGLRSSDCDEGCEEANEKSDLHLRKSVCFLEGILILIRCLATSRPSVPRLLLYTIRLCQITSNSRVAPYCIHRVPTCCATSAKSPEICQSPPPPTQTLLTAGCIASQLPHSDGLPLHLLLQPVGRRRPITEGKRSAKAKFVERPITKFPVLKSTNSICPPS